MKNNGKQGCGNDGLWEKRKTKSRFPSFPTALGNRKKARFPHFHSPGDDREEKWKSKSRIPTFPSRLSIFLENSKRRIPLNAGFPSFRLIVRLEYAVKSLFLSLS